MQAIRRGSRVPLRPCITGLGGNFNSSFLPITAVLIPVRFRSNGSIPITPSPEVLSTPLQQKPPPLSLLPTSLLLRTYALTTLMTYPTVLTLSIRLLASLTHPNPTFPLSVITPTRNPLVKALLKSSIYRQFCAGENPAEVAKTVEGLRGWGVGGVMMGWAREVEKRGEESWEEEKVEIKLDEGRDTASRIEEETEKEKGERMVKEWADAACETVEVARKGDFICLKLTGAGPLSLEALTVFTPTPPVIIENALSRIMNLARSNGVRVCIDAEQSTIQPTIDAWTINLEREFNRGGYALVYGTYQAYLTRTPEVLSGHLGLAEKEGWVLGAKCVRGAYLGSEDKTWRETGIWSRKGQTDDAYNNIARGLVGRMWGGILNHSPPKFEGKEISRGASKATPFPMVDIILATHNITSARLALSLYSKNSSSMFRAESPFPRLVVAQLTGMADHVSCEMIQSSSSAAMESSDALDVADGDRSQHLKTYKYLVWGPVPACLAYLARRVEENRDAVERTGDSSRELKREIGRRLRGLWKWQND